QAQAEGAQEHGDHRAAQHESSSARGASPGGTGPPGSWGFVRTEPAPGNQFRVGRHSCLLRKAWQARMPPHPEASVPVRGQLFPGKTSPPAREAIASSRVTLTPLTVATTVVPAE